MNECIKNIIKFKSFCDLPIYNGKFIEDYVQIDLKILSNLANENELTGKQFGENAINSAIENVASDILNSANDLVLNSKVEVLNLFGNFNNVPFANGGLQIRKNTSSLLSKIQIENVKVKPLFNGPSIILINGFQYPFTAVYGVEQVVKLDFITNETSVNLKIADNTQQFSAITTTATTCGSCSGKKYNLYAQPLFNLLPSQTYSTFLPNASLVCDPSDLICLAVKNQNVKNLFAKAIAIYTAIIVFERLSLSNRLNDTTININKEAVDSYQLDLQAKYNELVFGLNFASGQKRSNIIPLTQIVKNNLKSTNDICVNCNSHFSTATVIF